MNARISVAVCAAIFLCQFICVSSHSLARPSHHHQTFDDFPTVEVSPLGLSESDRALWIQNAFAERLHAHNLNSTQIDKCVACEVVVQLVQWVVNSNLSVQVLEQLATMYCEQQKLYGGFPDVCYGMISEDGPELIYVLSKVILDPAKVCTDLKFCNSSQSIIIPPGFDGDSVLNLSPPSPLRPSKPRNVGRFAHLSDIHLDGQYAIGSDANCGKPLCCRSDEYPENPLDAAGKFGDIRNCDSSPDLLDSLVHFIQSLPAVDFVVWTGDEPPHDVWEQSRSGNLNATAVVTNAMSQAFKNTMVFPAIGNHESFPVDQFEGPNADYWLYSALAQDWSRWLPTDALDTLSFGGFYSMLLPGTNLRVISVNSNYANSGNFWLLMETGDVAQQLAWLNTTLSQSRANDERVYIIGHIPWRSAVNAYAIQIHELVEEYSEIIAGQFYGHTHHDEFQVFRDNSTNTKPLSIALVAPSITPYGNVMPSFRVYEYDTDTFEVIDYTSYVLNITAANENGTALWREDYQLLEEYAMEGATPTDFQQLITRMNTDDNLFSKFRDNFFRRPAQPCDGNCKKANLCSLSSVTDTLYHQCLSSPVDSNHDDDPFI